MYTCTRAGESAVSPRYNSVFQLVLSGDYREDFLRHFYLPDEKWTRTAAL